MESNSNTAAKLQEVITAKTMESLNSKSEKPKAKKQSKPKTATQKVVKEAKKQSKPKTATQKVVKEAKKQSVNNLMEDVVSKREVKYIYPADCLDTLARKKWRQGVRNELRKLELSLRRIEDKNSKEYKAKEKAYNSYKNSVVKKEAKIA